MRAWDDFHPRVMPYVLGCPVPMVNQALVDAAREFCLVTKAWRETVEFPAYVGFDAYDFDHPMGTEVVQVVRASVDGKQLRLLAARDVPRFADSICSGGQTLYRLSEQQYRILPAPSASQAVSITLALRPTDSGTGVGDDVFAKHVETIAAGARAILQRMPRRAWTDLAQAQIDHTKFERGMNWAAENHEFLQTAPAQRRVKAWG